MNRPDLGLPRVLPLALLFFSVAVAARRTPAADAPAAPGIVINEVMFHPPDDRDELQWIELWNPGSKPVSLTGWALRKGLKFTFTNTVSVGAGEFLVVSRDRVAFRARYGTNVPVLGDFSGRLNHRGETIELADRDGKLVDTIKYETGAGWPVSPDGMSPSLERIVSRVSGEDPANWAPSPLPERRRAAGTPGKPNQSAATNLPPAVVDVQFKAPAPGAAMPVSARVSDADGVREVRLSYRVIPMSGLQKPAAAAAGNAEVEVPMTPTPAASGGAAVYTASIPAQADGRIVRFHIRAIDAAGSERVVPHPADVRPDWSVYIGRNTSDARVPVVSLLQLGGAEQAGSNLRNSFGPPGRRNQNQAPGEAARGVSALVYFPTNGAAPVLHDFIRITPRQGGWKVRMSKDQLLEGMTTANVIFEGQARFILSEHLSYELFRAAGLAAPLSGHWRVSFNGQPVGFFLYVEQPNSGFLRRNGIDPKGDLYKILWYGSDLVGQHEKKNNPQSGHAALVETIEALRRTSGAEQWKIIQERFDVDAFATYYAVNQCIQNWDGYFNNHFVYRAPGPAGKWTVIPWDNDKTWGDYDGASAKYDWYEMPLTYGMNGDRPPRALLGGGPFGGPQWWRQAGWFSGPLLANPQFRARFLARLREICAKQFTPQAMEIPIAKMEYALEPEVRFRAGPGRSRNMGLPMAFGGAGDAEPAPGDVEGAVARFRRHIASYRNQTVHRREFLLRELGTAH